MSKRSSSSRARRRAALSAGGPAQPAADPPSVANPRRTWWLFVWVTSGLTLLLAVGLVWYFVRRPKPFEADTPVAYVEEFQKRRNADDPSAADLLAPKPKAPSDPVDRDEADRIFANLVLHGKFHVEEIWPQKGSDRIVLALSGEDAVEPVPYRTPSGVLSTPKKLTDPSVLVEVRDGKIHGLRVEVPGEVVRQYVRLRKENNPAAAQLLGPAPTVPAKAVTEEEADRLNAEFILRGDYKVERFRPDPSDPNAAHPRYVLILSGSDAQPTLKVRNAQGGVDTVQKTISNPDVVVEVRDDKIYALRAGMHRDANEKEIPNTAEGRKRVEDAFRKWQEQQQRQ